MEDCFFDAVIIMRPTPDPCLFVLLERARPKPYAPPTRPKTRLYPVFPRVPRGKGFLALTTAAASSKHSQASRYASNFDFFLPGTGNNRIDFILTNARGGKRYQASSGIT